MVGNIQSIELEQEMKTSYIEYAMSVIVGRALPDVRDGLKPVHRRILFSMNEQGMVAGKPFKKSARVVGDVLGKYHPHGDSAVYDALVRMAQDFSLRYPLIDGQGNFGSIDGDGAAAMRYTEARMTKMSNELLQNIDEKTVDFMPNFDESLEEPTVLPSRLPGLLINGSAGIAVGMATNIPPHNLSEVCEGIVALIDNPEIDAEELMKYIKAPDFPTGANICGLEGVAKAYREGKGSVTIRAQASVEPAPHKKDRQCIIIKELPYQVNKSNLIVKIAELVHEKKIKGISDLRDESGRQGMRIYIEIKKDTRPEVVLNQLYKHTQLQTNFGINMLAIVGGVPKLLTLKEVLEEFVKFREDVVNRRTQFRLEKAKARAHILEGLKIALANLEEVIKLIKNSKDTAEAKVALVKKFKLSEIQAQAILDMKLSRLTNMETHKIEEEYKELLASIKDFEDILQKVERRMKIIKEETIEVLEKYGDERRTQLLNKIEDLSVEDLIPNEQVVVLLTKNGYVKRLPAKTFRNQSRGGKGVIGMQTKDEDEIDSLFVTSTHSFLAIFTNKGKVYRFKVHEIPDASRNSKGQSINNIVMLEEDEHVTAAIDVKDFNDETQFFIMATKGGVIKKTAVSQYANIRSNGVIAINLDEGDSLNWVKKSDGTRDVAMVTKLGLIIRFHETDARPIGRTARGVKGINLAKDDAVVSMDVIHPEEESTRYALIVTKQGYGKRTLFTEYRAQARAGKGVKVMTLRANDEVCMMCIVQESNDLMVVTQHGTVVRQKTKDISVQGRAAKGVIVQRLMAGDEVADVAVIKKIEEEPMVVEETSKKESKADQPSLLE